MQLLQLCLRQQRRGSVLRRFSATELRTTSARTACTVFVIASHFSQHVSVQAHAVQYDRDRCANWAKGANHQPPSFSSQADAVLCCFASIFCKKESNYVRCCRGNKLNDNTCLCHVMDHESDNM